MAYSDDSPNRPVPILVAARTGELTRPALWLERLYTIDYHVYRQFGQALDAEAQLGAP